MAQGIEKAAAVLEHAPGPSPWYLRNNAPNLSGFSWSGDPEKTEIYLENAAGEAVLGVGFYCYVSSIGSDQLLLWYQTKQDAVPKEIHIEIIDIHELKPIIKDADPLIDFHIDISPIHRVGGLVTELEIPNTLSPGVHQIRVPTPFTSEKELLILFNDVRGIRSLLIIVPANNSAEVVPFNWFNEKNYDLGYEWITRVAREPGSKRIYGEGFRIKRFLLTEDLTQVQEWFDN
jgi:hypothetical protein